MSLFSGIFGKETKLVELSVVENGWVGVLKPGDTITEEAHKFIFEHSFHCFQPFERPHGYFQTKKEGFDYAFYEDENGERHAGRVFDTFGKKEDGTFVYYGECFLGGTLDRSKDKEEFLSDCLKETEEYQEDM